MMSFRGSVDDTVTQKVERKEFPTRRELYAQAGYTAEQAPALPISWLLMYATSYGTPDKAGKHMPAHFNDAAHSANVRYAETGVRFSPRNIMGSEHHDEWEEEGKKLAKNDPQNSLAVGWIVVDNIHYLLHHS